MKPRGGLFTVPAERELVALREENRTLAVLVDRMAASIAGSDNREPSDDWGSRLLVILDARREASDAAARAERLAVERARAAARPSTAMAEMLDEVSFWLVPVLCFLGMAGAMLALLVA